MTDGTYSIEEVLMMHTVLDEVLEAAERVKNNR
jgi:hypothetical protein